MVLLRQLPVVVLSTPPRPCPWLQSSNLRRVYTVLWVNVIADSPLSKNFLSGTFLTFVWISSSCYQCCCPLGSPCHPYRLQVLVLVPWRLWNLVRECYVFEHNTEQFIFICQKQLIINDIEYKDRYGIQQDSSNNWLMIIVIVFEGIQSCTVSNHAWTVFPRWLIPTVELQSCRHRI